MKWQMRKDIEKYVSDEVNKMFSSKKFLRIFAKDIANGILKETPCAVRFVFNRQANKIETEK